MDHEMLGKQIISHSWFPRRSAEYYRWYPKSLHTVEQSSIREMDASGIEGIYVHIPFCDEICSFCPFNKQMTSPELVTQYVVAIEREIDRLKDRQPTEGISFIYFGGGTPSVLSPRQVEDLVDTASRTCKFATDIEITMEAHPRNCTDEYLSSLRDVGINRISSGIQSFSDQILSTIHATHVANLSYTAIIAMAKHFDNWGVDLLYRCPGQSTEGWGRDINTLLEVAPPGHVSCYTLALPNDRDQPTVEEDVEMAAVAQSILEDAGYTHYASCATGGFDYAMPGRECVYERRHWGAPQASYAALGSGAIGFLAGMTTVNYHDTARYIRAAIQGDSSVFLSSTQDVGELRHRYMVLGVKTLNVDLLKYQEIFGRSAHEDFRQEFKTLTEQQMVEIDERSLQLTNLGRFYVDQISETFWSFQEISTPHPETNALRAVEQRAKL